MTLSFLDTYPRHVNEVYFSHLGYRRRRERYLPEKNLNPYPLLFAIPCKVRVTMMNKVDKVLALKDHLLFLFQGSRGGGKR